MTKFAHSYKNDTSEAVKRAAREAGRAPAEVTETLASPSPDPFEGDLSLLPDAEFDQLYAAATEAQNTLDDVAASAGATARRSSAEFVVTPTVLLMQEKECAGQVADNAQRAAQEHRAKIVPLEQENTRRRERRELIELRAAVDMTARDAEVGGKVLALIERFEADLRVHLSDLRVTLAERNALLPRLNMLEERHGGAGPYTARHQRFPLARPVAMISQLLHERFGGQLSMNGVGNFALTTWDASGNPDHPIVDLTMRLRPYRTGA